MSEQQLKVLFVCEDEDDYLAIDDLFSEIADMRIALDRIKTYEAALEEIDHHRHDVYLIDYFLAGQNGLDLLRTVDVSTLVAEVLERHAPTETIQVITNIAQDLPSVYIDPQQFGQVLTNLITMLTRLCPREVS